MNRTRVAATILGALAIHIAFDGAVPLWLGWKVPFGNAAFIVAGIVALVSLALVVAPNRTPRFGFYFACAGATVAAASVIIPLALEREFLPSSYPYPGGRLFNFIQLAAFTGVAVLLRRRIASNNSFESDALKTTRTSS